MRLRRTNSTGQGFLRVRAGSGFSYRSTKDGAVADTELRERFERLGIPPAWKDVWICPYDNGHIQAIGYDAAGRKQYIYHPTWREKKDRIKFDRAMELAESLPTARRRVTMDLRSDGLTRERALAAAFRMLDTGSLRVGSERYAESNGSHGLTTLLCSHARVHGDIVELKFPAKSHKAWESDIRDKDLAAIVRQLKKRGPNARLLAYKEGTTWHPLTAAEVNEYVRERTGGEFTAKDFRTLHGTVAAATSLAKHGVEAAKTARTRAVAQAMRDAAEVLSNTPSIARASYVDPRLVDRYHSGETIDPSRLGSAESEIRGLLFQ
ncbi:DNA topoisomerase IB [Amnibacterium flavum]|uniref:DNA topoisomerase n=1 Tax=Amnibacterium flavum TaxID=2173173 RepID=A0A2V1HRF4_9MICO|nr:DNA topoisomerase IB [Amnibacterium flavum]PVZ95128.1 DNA topoisomerase [Amnibacterium flavum]